MAVKSINLRRFNILAAYIRYPTAYLLSDELEHLATDGDRVLGVLIRETESMVISAVWFSAKMNQASTDV